MIGVSTGGRISELLSLQIADTYQNRKPVTDLLFDKSIVKGKSESRAVPVNADGRHAIAALVNWHRERNKKVSKFLIPFLKLGFEFALLVVIVNAGLRDISEVATVLILARLIMSVISRLAHIPYAFLNKFNRIVLGGIICALKIALEVGIFFEIERDINIPMDNILLILIFMALRNVSDTWSLIAIEFDE